MALGLPQGSSPRVACRHCPCHRCHGFYLARPGAWPSPPPLVCGIESFRQRCRRVAVPMASDGEPRRCVNSTDETMAHQSVETNRRSNGSARDRTALRQHLIRSTVSLGTAHSRPGPGRDNRALTESATELSSPRRRARRSAPSATEPRTAAPRLAVGVRFRRRSLSVFPYDL